VNFLFICCNIPAAPLYVVYISQLIRYSRACGSYQDFPDRGLLLTRKLLNQKKKDKQRSTKHTHKAKDRVTRTPLKTWGELRCSGRVGSSCSTIDTHRVNLVTNPVISHEKGKDRDVFTTSRRGSCYSIFSFMCMFCRSLFVLFLLAIVLSAFFYLLIMIILLVSLNSSYIHARNKEDT
jgi:hypothetical protein